MAGIYIHVPFCRRACHYCDFHFTTNLKNTQPLVIALLKEIELRADYLAQEPISTIYFGGGTPSLLPTAAIDSILQAISRYHTVNNQVEVTLEANPEDLTVEKLTELKSIGINRLSLGTQSFIDAELKWMNRMHSAQQAIRGIAQAQQIGFNNISIDLIFGLPHQTIADWEHSLQTATALQVPHISSYGLTIENKTVLGNRIAKGLEAPPDESLFSTFYTVNMEYFPAHGFEHYEISNFAKSGFISNHNSSYWRGTPYLGLGPSAHSFNGISRQWNVRSNAAYIERIAAGKIFFELEKLTTTNQLNEHIMIGLRTKWGIEKEKVETIKKGAWTQICTQVGKQPASYFKVTPSCISLSKQGKLVADSLAADLFFA